MYQNTGQVVKNVADKVKKAEDFVKKYDFNTRETLPNLKKQIKKEHPQSAQKGIYIPA